MHILLIIVFIVVSPILRYRLCYSEVVTPRFVSFLDSK
nr:MAG TPA: hypothetical protein [Caudoviricetes sp.]